MHYFTFQTKDGLAYAAVEDAKRAREYEAAGWTRVGLAAYRAAWKAQVAKTLKERVVGEGVR
jgi:hypothetical protein